MHNDNDHCTTRFIDCSYKLPRDSLDFVLLPEETPLHDAIEDNIDIQNEALNLWETVEPTRIWVS